MDSRLVSPVGFSKGWAELMLKNPPPLMPKILIATCEACGPWAMISASRRGIALTGVFSRWITSSR